MGLRLILLAAGIYAYGFRLLFCNYFKTRIFSSLWPYRGVFNARQQAPEHSAICRRGAVTKPPGTTLRLVAFPCPKPDCRPLVSTEGP